MSLIGFRYNLNWKRDFTPKDSRPPGEHIDAFTNAPVINAVRQMNFLRGDDGLLRFKRSSVRIIVRMDKANSWVVKSARTDELLQHEQGHYNISALAGRDMERELLSLRTTSVEELESERDKFINGLDDLKDEVSAEYDDDFKSWGTNHGKRSLQQRQWDIHFNRLMNLPDGRLMGLFPNLAIRSALLSMRRF